jgi:hypothetical protein
MVLRAESKTRAADVVLAPRFSAGWDAPNSRPEARGDGGKLLQDDAGELGWHGHRYLRKVRIDSCSQVTRHSGVPYPNDCAD